LFLLICIFISFEEMNQSNSNQPKKAKPKTKVVDNLKTQLTDLLASLDQLYKAVDQHLGRLGSEFDEINTLLVEGFRDVLDQRPPVDHIDSPSSTSDSDEEEEGSDCQGGDKKKFDIENLVRMVQSWSGPR